MPAEEPRSIVSSVDITNAEAKLTTRPEGADASTLPSMLADMSVVRASTTDDEEEIEDHFEISIVQKMLSAVVGSVLTSLLGMLPQCQNIERIRDADFYPSHSARRRAGTATITASILTSRARDA